MHVLALRLYYGIEWFLRSRSIRITDKCPIGKKTGHPTIDSPLAFGYGAITGRPCKTYEGKQDYVECAMTKMTAGS